MSTPKRTRPSGSTPRADDSPKAKISPLTKARTAPVLVGARLRKVRESQGITLRQFARDLEVSASFISQLETGKAQPSVATFFAICSALGISTEELFDDDIFESEVPPATDAARNNWRVYDGMTSVSPMGRAIEGDIPPTPPPTSPVVTPEERRVITLDSGVTWESLTATHHDKAEFMLVRYDVGGSSTLDGRLLRHAGTEYGYVLCGNLEVTVGFESYILGPGDSITYDSSRPHRLANAGDEPVEAIWMNLAYRAE